MDQGSNVQDENLINDQVAAALADSGTTDDAPTGGFVPAPTVTPVADDAAPAPPAPAEAEAPAEAPPTQIPAPTIPAPDLPDSSAQLVAEAGPSTPTPSIENHSKASVGPDLSGVTLGSGDDDELMGIKQKALEQLSPLVNHLDLPPTQKFDTYMEIIRASDDKSLIQPAFDAAQAIDDEDKKAQALLDVVNEVNYLTQDHEAASSS